MLYAKWRACERVGIRAPCVKSRWEDNDILTQAEILAYSQIRDIEEQKERAILCGSMLH